jgi:choline dehydrogenase-like flavoprotein
LSADVVVIGSGAGGAVAAARFAESGREVVILEEESFSRHATSTNKGTWCRDSLPNRRCARLRRIGDAPGRRGGRGQP